MNFINHENIFNDYLHRKYNLFQLQYRKLKFIFKKYIGSIAGRKQKAVFYNTNKLNKFYLSTKQCIASLNFFFFVSIICDALDTKLNNNDYYLILNKEFKNFPLKEKKPFTKNSSEIFKKNLTKEFK